MLLLKDNSIHISTHFSAWPGSRSLCSEWGPGRQLLLRRSGRLCSVLRCPAPGFSRVIICGSGISWDLRKTQLESAGSLTATMTHSAADTHVVLVVWHVPSWHLETQGRGMGDCLDSAREQRSGHNTCEARIRACSSPVHNGLPALQNLGKHACEGLTLLGSPLPQPVRPGSLCNTLMLTLQHFCVAELAQDGPLHGMFEQATSHCTSSLLAAPAYMRECRNRA